MEKKMKKFWIKMAILVTALLLVCAHEQSTALEFVQSCTIEVSEERAH